MSFVRIALVVAVVALAALPLRAEETRGSDKGQPAAVVAEKCEHGVKKSICTRCNPKLDAVFKARNDWCAEHALAESQCVICHPDLAKQGVK